MTDLPTPSTRRPAPGQLTMTAPRRGKPPRHWADLTVDERAAAAVEAGLPAFRAKQLSTHYFVHHTDDPEAMTDLPKAGREELVRGLMPQLLTPVRAITADAGATIKSVYRLHDGALVESVLMRYPRRATICISSQAGCGMNCPFCATGQEGLTRNMSTAEIVDQVVAANRMLKEAGPLAAGADDLGAELGAESGEGGEPASSPGTRGSARVTNVVFMGMGEPLHNYENVVAAVRLLTDDNGIGLSARRITVSTVGLVPGIERWMQDNPPAKLAISLHATTDERRAELMPINKAYPLETLFKTLRRFAHVTKDPITFEYIMIAEFNDREEDVDNLAHWLKNIPAKMNLIRLHPTGSGLKPSSDEAIDRFMGWLTDAGIRSTLRESRGLDDEAACGMLFTQEPFRPTKVRAWERA